jgi:hypothetical protein
MSPLLWIVTRPQCEAATALSVFYLGQPHYLDRDDKDEGNLLSVIRERWTAGTFAMGGIIAFTYAEHYRADQDLVGVPLSMRVSLPGRIVDEASKSFGDGFPRLLLPPFI